MHIPNTHIHTILACMMYLQIAYSHTPAHALAHANVSGTVLVEDSRVRTVALWCAFYEVLEHFFMPCSAFSVPNRWSLHPAALLQALFSLPPPLSPIEAQQEGEPSFIEGLAETRAPHALCGAEASRRSGARLYLAWLPSGPRPTRRCPES
jgi:hypothetical protein